MLLVTHSDSEASLPPATTPIDAKPPFELSTPPLPSLSSSKIEFEMTLLPGLPDLPDLPSPPLLFKNETGSMDIASLNCQGDGLLGLNITRHVILLVRGLQHQCLHIHERPSPLHPRLLEPSRHTHDQICYLRLPSQMVNHLL